MAFLRLRNLSVEFPVYQGGSRSLKKMLVAATTQGNLARDAIDRINVRALNDVTLDIEDGDRLGLIGANGAGKTTLLRVLAEFTRPPAENFIRPEGCRPCSTSRLVSTPRQPAARTSSCAACT